MMISRFSVTVILILAAAIWGGSLWALGHKLSWAQLAPFSITLFALTTCLAVFDRVLWKWFPFSFFTGLPNLNGTWCVELKSSYTDPDTGQNVPPVLGYATVRQRFSSLSIRLMTEQAESFLVANNILHHDDGTIQIYGIYQSDPSIHVRGKTSEIHYGSFKYKVIRSPALEMTGHYWTDRNTTGSIRLHSCSPLTFESYADARKTLESNTPE